MPRAPRCDVAGHLYHALNRRNQRDTIFHKDGDFEAFERVLDEELQKFPVDLLNYCWLPNHWHMAHSTETTGRWSDGAFALLGHNDSHSTVRTFGRDIRGHTQTDILRFSLL